MLGATTLGQVTERTGLRPTAAAIAFQKLVADRPGRRGRGGGLFPQGPLASIPGDARVRVRVLGVVADSFDDRVGPRRALVDEGLLRRDTAARQERV